MVLLSDAKRNLLFLRTRLAHKNNALRASRCVGVFEFENAVDFFNDTVLVIAACQLRHEALTNILNTSHLQIVFEHCIARNSLPLFFVKARCGLAQIPYYCVGCFLVVLVQEDELVGCDTHLLEGDRLGLRPWETLNDPALLSLLNGLNLLLDELNYDFIANVTIRFKRLLNLLAMLLVLLSDLASDEIAN